MPNFLVLATAWGPKFGGINSFNHDFCRGLAAHIEGRGKVFCSVLSCSVVDIQNAKEEGVSVFSIKRPETSPGYDKSWAFDVWTQFHKQFPNERIDWWVGHDVITGEAAVQGPEIAQFGRSALIMHMNYADYKPIQLENGSEAHRKGEHQRTLFQKADCVFANGPLLAKALRDITPVVTMLIPGFANVPMRPANQQLRLITFGRMDRENDRVKQGSLAVAAFASAIKRAHGDPNYPESLRSNPQLTVIGIDEPGGPEERALKDFADTRADRLVNVVALPFENDRSKLLEELGRANIALMLSWHEGFGLAGWEAVAGEVPLIVSRRTGLWELLKESFGERMAEGFVTTVDVRGSRGDPKGDNFRSDDEGAVRDAIIAVARKPQDARRAASKLKQELQQRWNCTWECTAEEFCNALEAFASSTNLDAPTEFRNRQSTTPPTSQFISIPQPTWPKWLSSSGLELPDSLLLRPESGIVPFHGLRAGVLDEIMQWALAPEPQMALRLQAGDGGSGKTRVFIEACKQLEQYRGWRAGFLARSQSIAQDLPRLLKESKPCLIVLDYAEGRTIEIVELVRTYLGAGRSPILRVGLVARDGGDWWDRLADAAGNDQSIAAVLRGIRTKTGPYRMSVETIESSCRATVFGEALRAYASFKDVPVPDPGAPDLSGEYFGRPLFIHMAALAALRGQPATNDQELLDVILGHERSYWRQLLSCEGLPDESMLLALEQVVALLTLCGGKRSAKEAKAVLALAPRMRDAEPSVRARMFDALRKLYPLDGGLAGLVPDLLGEWLVSQALSRDDEILDSALGAWSKSGEIRVALTVLTRLARRVPSERRWLERILDQHLVEISEDALQVGIETGSPMSELLVEAIKSAKPQTRRQIIDMLRVRMPAETVNLAKLSLEVRHGVVQFLETKKSGAPAKRRATLLDALLSLSMEFRRLGHFQEAAQASQNAFEKATAAGVADIDPAKFANIAQVYASDLSNVGRFDEALSTQKQAEAIMRKLADKRPDLHRSDWIVTLGNLANRLGEHGLYNEALEKQQEAVAFLDSVEAKGKKVDRERRAISLGNLSNRLGGVGRFGEALATKERAEAIWRELAAENPDAYVACLASSLRDRSACLSRVGRLEEARALAERAEEEWHALANRQPDVHSAGWALSLGNLAIRLSELGQFEAALALEEKAEAIWQILVEKQHDTYTPRWAESLSNISVWLGNLGRFDQALQRANQAEFITQALAESQPDAHMDDWAIALGASSNLLFEVGRIDEALAKMRQVEGITRELAEKQPDAHSRLWATSLTNLAVVLRYKGCLAEALALEIKAEKVIRVLAAGQPEPYRKTWAASLSNLAEAQLSMKLCEEGLASARLALLKIGPLVEKYPRAYQSWLGFSQRVASEAYLGLGNFDEALKLAGESVGSWVEVASYRPGYESTQIAKAFRALIQCNIAAGLNVKAVEVLRQALDLLQGSLRTNPRPLRSLISDMIALVASIDANAVETVVPSEIRQLLNG